VNVSVAAPPFDAWTDPARSRSLDVLLCAVALLCALGMVMAVSVQGTEKGVLAALEGQGGKLAIATVGFLVCAMVPLRLLQRVAPWLFGLGVALCLIAALFGPERNYAHRWLPWGGQPVEFARFALIVFAAARVKAAGVDIGTFRRGMVPMLGAAALLAAVLAMQPDMGNAALALLVTAAIALVAGVRVRWFLVLGLPALVAFGLVAWQFGYIRARVEGFVDGKPSFQVAQSLLAIGSGGTFGRGIGGGVMKLGHVPEANNDFVFAIVGEELGLVGGIAVVLAYGCILFAGLRLMARARDPFARYLVFGFLFAICAQAAINLCVVTGVIPPKGIDLPFVSSGGTNLLFCMSAIGVVGNAARTSCAVARDARRVGADRLSPGERELGAASPSPADSWRL
jgi:cell division protein FtsW